MSIEERRVFVRALASAVLRRALAEVEQAEQAEHPVEAHGQPGAAA